VLNDYFGRLSYLLSQGQTRNRILLLNPSTSGYLYTPSSQKGELRTVVNPEAARLSGYANWLPVEGLEPLIQQLERRLPKEIEWNEPERIPQGVHHLRRVMEDGSSVYFIVNSSPQTVKSSLKLKGLEIWNPWTGKTEPVPYTIIRDQVEVQIELPEEGSILLRVYVKQPEAKAGLTLSLAVDMQSSTIPLKGTTEVKIEKDNMLVLDYCDLQVGSKQYSGINTLHAQRLIYECHGFESNPWDNGVQFKRDCFTVIPSLATAASRQAYPLVR
jgi:hypothetical protein